MFVLKEKILFKWSLKPTPYSYSRSDFGVNLQSPDKKSIYSFDPIRNNFVAPTAETKGLAEYEFTPNKIGVWKIALSVKNENVFELYSEYNFRVSEPDVEVCQQIINVPEEAIFGYGTGYGMRYGA